MKSVLNARYGLLILTAAFLLIISLIYIMGHHLLKPGNKLPGKSSETACQLDELNKAFDSTFLLSPLTGIKIATEAIDLTRKAGDSLGLARFMLRQAACYQMLDNSDSALITFRGSLLIAEKLKNPSLIAKCRNGLANYYLRQEEYQKAYYQLTEALKAAEKAGDKHTTGLIFNGMGLVNISLNKPDTAIEFFRKAGLLCHETGDLINEAGISLNIANCYAERGQFNEALKFYGENLSIIQRLSDSSQIVLALLNLANANRQLGNFNESFRFLDRALKCLEEFPDQSLHCSTLIEKGRTCLASGQPETARAFFKQSLAISSGTLSRSNRAEAFAGLSEVAESEGNYREALQFFRLLTIVKDSIMNDETRSSISEIRIKNDLQKKEYENRLLTGKYELQRKRGIYTGILSVTFSLLLLLVAILVWVSRKNLKKSFELKQLQNEVLLEKIRSNETISQLEKLRFRDELEARNKELTSASLQLVSKNKILSDISAKASESYNSGAMNRESFNGLQRIIRENQNADKEWKQFKELFEKVHSDFFTGLKASFPELTENELRLCAYLRINLQNKEISKILNVNSATIVTSRYRIRKKMSLDSKAVLEDFLRKF